MTVTHHKNLLVELFVEELPPKALKKLGEAFGSALRASLYSQGLVGEHSALVMFATPRRLAAHISGVAAVAADKAVSAKLMPVAVALAADGTPTPALLKKLAALGADASVVPQLKRAMDGKAESLFLDSVQPGATLAVGLQKALDEALAKLPIPKVMQYQLADGWTSVNFVRPAHGLVALHGADVVPVGVLGLTAGRQTQGHRFEASMDPVVLQNADHYARQLEEQGAVIAGFDHRRADIVRQLHAAASKLGLKPIEDEALLDEVTGLVERPNVLTCSFEKEFLDVPQECLILTMKANQKYFPLLDDSGKLTNQFLIVSNIRPADPSRVIEGNERVVRPRLADAKFFFDQDRKKTLASRVPGLDKVVYHGKLGTQGERTQRVRAIAWRIGQMLGGLALADQAYEAATLTKADLVTDMVGEFPELQGIMGGYYARHDGVRDAIAEAVEDHYKPRFAGDSLPRGDVGLAVALADKIETLTGLFCVGQQPSGDKDPFALRRHALGVARMLVEKDLPLQFADLTEVATEIFRGSNIQTSEPVDFGKVEASLHVFVLNRLTVSLRDQGYSSEIVEAVLAAGNISWGSVPKRLEAVRAFLQLPEATPLAAANKRVGNILRTASAISQSNIDEKLLVEPAERALALALNEIAPRAEAAFAQGDFTASLKALAALKAPIDAFFEEVMVNADDLALRANRIALLRQMHAAMNQVARLESLAV